jgi:2-amino-4-hydroxy-6-hydroxymethyldihydropteridine diphosphokinase
LNRGLILIGSNQEKEQVLRRSLEKIDRTFGILSVSDIYETIANGGINDIPSYYNAAVVVETRLSALALKEGLRSIETELGRDRRLPKGNLVGADLDLLLFNELVLDEGGLLLPDPDLTKLGYVLFPAAQASPDWLHPVLGRRLQDLRFEFSEDPGIVRQFTIQAFPTGTL